MTTVTAEQRASLEAGLAELMPVLASRMHGIIRVGQVYQKAYPADTVPVEVLNAVTVPVPFIDFGILVGIASAWFALNATEENLKAASDAASPKDPLDAYKAEA